MQAYSFPVVLRHLTDEILGHQLPEDLGNCRKVGLVLLKLDAVDEGCQLKNLLSGALVVATQVLGKLLFIGQKKQTSQRARLKKCDAPFQRPETKATSPSPSAGPPADTDGRVWQGNIRQV